MTKLELFKRAGKTKSEINDLRRRGDVPAVLYGLGYPAQKVFLKGTEFQAMLRQMKPGLLATTLFEVFEKGHPPGKALIKDIHYHRTTYAVEHIDFALVDEKTYVTVNVPIRIIGAAECPGLKLGGTLRQVIRALQVTCLPQHIPQEFQLDIRQLEMGQSKRLSDIEMPSTVKPSKKLEQVAVVIAKQKAA